MGDTIKSVLEAVILNTLALQHLDQLRRDKFLTVLPHNMKSLAERPKGSHGDITERQIEAKQKLRWWLPSLRNPRNAPCLACLATHIKGRERQLAILRPEATPTPAEGQKTDRASPSTDTLWESTDTGGEDSRKTHGKSLFVLHIFHPRFGESQVRVLVWNYV